MSMNKATVHDVLDRWKSLWMEQASPIVPPSEFVRDIVIELPLYDKAILRGYIEHTGRQRFEVQVSGKDRKVRPHYFSKRRHAKKYMRKQMARTEHILFKGCYPTSIVTDGEGAPTLHGLTFEYIEAVKFNG